MSKELQDIWKRVIKEFKYTLYVIKNDPQVLIKVRTLALAYMVIATVIYGAYDFLVSASEKQQNKQQNIYQNLENDNPIAANTLLTEALIKLKKEDETLLKDISLLQFQQNLHREEQLEFGRDQQFSKVILTLESGAPKLLKNGQGTMTTLPPKKSDGYTIHRVKIEGESDYTTLLTYLAYLGNRPEISELDQVDIENINRDQLSDAPLLKYSIRVGRVSDN